MDVSKPHSSSVSMTLQCAAALFELLDSRLSDLRKKLPPGSAEKTPYLIRGRYGSKSGGRLSVYPRHLLERLTVDFAFVDAGAGFVAFFKAYDTSSWGESLLSDLYHAALIHEEQVLDCLVQGTDAQSPGRLERPWTVYLFALIPAFADAAQTEKELQSVWREIHKGRLTEEVGLSLLHCYENSDGNTLNQIRNGAQATEIRRFLAPLLLNTREWASLHQDRIESWRKDLVEKLAAATGGNMRPDDVSAWAEERIRERVQPLLRASHPTSCLRLRSLKNIQMRRFACPEWLVLPFGELTLLYGCNGSGKTTLLEAAELALTGRLQRLDHLTWKTGSPQDGRQLYQKALKNRLGPAQGQLEVELFDVVPESQLSGTGRGAKPVALPVQYQAGVDSPDRTRQPDRPFLTNVDSFYLRQGEIRRFVEMAPDQRYDWMVERLGIPAQSIEEALGALHKEIRAYIDERWRKVTAKRLSATSKDLTRNFAEEAEQVLSRLTRPEGMLRKLNSQVEQMTESLGMGGPAFVDSLRSLTQRGAKIMSQTRQTVNAVVSALKAADQGTAGSSPTDLARGLSDSIHECLTLAQEVTPIRRELAEICASVNDAVQAGRVRVRYWETRIEPARLGMDVNRLREVEAELATVQEARQAVDAGLILATTFETVVSAAANLQQQVAILAKLSSLDWRGRPPDWPNRVAQMQQDLDLVRPNVAALASLRGRDEFHKEYLSSVQSQLRQAEGQLLSEMRFLRNSIATGQSGQGDDPVWGEHFQTLVAFARRMGITTSAESMDSPEGLKSTIARFDALHSVLDTLELLEDCLTEQLTDDQLTALLDELTRWATIGDDWDLCGLGPLLALLDRIQRQKESVNEVVRNAVANLLEREAGPIWHELVWAFTAFSWYQPCPELEVQHARKDLAHIETDYGPAAAVFNMAEQNILGLAWFLASYLLVGRMQSRAIILDDPFQQLDDANLSAFVRIFDEVVRVLGAGQVVIALHQPSIYEYLRLEFGGRVVSNQVRGQVDKADHEREVDKSMALWEVQATGTNSSTVRPVVLELRSPRLSFPFQLGETARPAV